MDTKPTTPTTAERIAHALDNRGLVHEPTAKRIAQLVGHAEGLKVVSDLIDSELERERQQVITVLADLASASRYTDDDELARARDAAEKLIAMLEPSREGK